jgi:mRNA-degrading endonuclease RelE of RelBE toxin-antitoxin system
MKIEVLIEAQVLEFFRRQPPLARRKLRAAIHAIEEGKEFPESLEDELDGFYKAKVDDYRLILQSVAGKNGPSFKVVFVERRKVVYKIFSQILGLD